MQRIKRKCKRGSSLYSFRSGSPGFSVIELLVVVVVISILAALLSAALNQTKSRARQITCLNNVRELGRAWYFYSDDGEDSLALNRTAQTNPNEEIYGRRNSTNSWVAGSPKEDSSPENLMKGSLFPYTRSVSLYRCPSDSSTVIDKQIPRTRSYSMSTYMNGDGAGMDPRVKTKLSEIINPSPSSVFVFIEEHESSIWSGGFFVSPRSRFTLASASWSSTPSDRHSQGGNLAFADLHVEHWKWAWPKNLNLNNRLAGNHHELRDLKRLQESIPVR